MSETKGKGSEVYVNNTTSLAKTLGKRENVPKENAGGDGALKFPYQLYQLAVTSQILRHLIGSTQPLIGKNEVQSPRN